MQRSEEVDDLQSSHPAAFLLLCSIARRARWKEEPCPVTGLQFGEAMIGDFKRAGLVSEKAYRHAKDVLRRAGLATFKGTNKGTVATLTDSRVFTLRPDSEGEQKGEQTGRPGADEGRAKGDPRGRPGATKEERYNKERNTDSLSAPTHDEVPLPAQAPTPPQRPVRVGGVPLNSTADLERRINGLVSHWGRPAQWNQSERYALMDSLSQFSELEPADWELLKLYLNEQMPVGAAFWQPRNRSKFVETFAGTFSDAQRWATKNGRKPRGPKETPSDPSIR